MSRDSYFFEGVLFGAVLGAIGGMLFAPQSGEETRARIKQFKDENEDLLQDTKDKTEGLIDKTKDAIEQGFDKLNKLIEENKTTAQKTPEGFPAPKDKG